MEIFETRPPYMELIRVRSIPVSQAGSVLVAHVSRNEAADNGALEDLHALRAAALWAPLVVHIPLDDVSTLRLIPPMLVATGARAFVPVPAPDLTLLRNSLIAPTTWRRHLPAWADLCFPDLTATSRAILNSVLLGDAPPLIQEGKRASRRAVNRNLAAIETGSHRQVSGALHVVTTLQFLWADPHRTIAEAAVHGPEPYADATSFSTRCFNVTGFRPSAIRGILGWEWPLWKALRHPAGIRSDVNRPR